MAERTRNADLFHLCESKREWIQNNLMHRKGYRKDQFVCRTDLVSTWTDDVLLSLFPMWNTHMFDALRENHVVTLSILIYIKFPIYEQEVAFRNMFSNELQHTWHDDQLPLKPEDSLYEWLQQHHKGSGKKFDKYQYLFLPHVIEQSSQGEIEEVDQHRPLPFDDDPEFEAGGAFGDVYKVTVAKSCHRTSRGARSMLNEHPIVLAFKRFSRERAHQSEVKNLETIRASLATHERIASHLAAFVHGSEFYIFYDHTDLGDLQILLQGGTKQILTVDEDIRSESKYDFEQRFHSPPRSLFLQQLVAIANALYFLHHELPHSTTDGLFCAHMDLKPDNILIFPTEHHGAPNVGKWKLTDFGIASFKQADGPRDAIGTVGEVLESSKDPRGTDRVLQGTYRAPELDEHSRPGKKNGAMCDIWSFGCIINEVFAFILPGLVGGADRAIESLDDFQRQKEGRLSDDNSPLVDFWFDYGQYPDGRRPQLKRGVRNWLEDRSTLRSYILGQMDPSPENSNEHTWIESLSKFIPKILEIQPHKRPTANTIRGQLTTILRELEEFENGDRSSTASVHQMTQAPTSSSATDILDQQEELTALDQSRTKQTTLTTQDIQLGSVYWALESTSPAKVISFDISPDTSIAAWLCLTAGIYEISVFDTSQNYTDKLICTIKDLPSNTQWKKVDLANGYMLVTGQDEVHKKGVVYHTTREPHQVEPGTRMRTLESWPGGWPEDCVKAAVSSRGYLAWENYSNNNAIYIWNGVSEQPARRVFYRGRGINSIGFSADGKYLCGWTSGGGENHVYMIDVFPDIRKPVERSASMKRVSNMEHACWVAQNDPACIIQENEYHDSYMFSFTPTSSQGPSQLRSPTVDRSGVWVSALGNHTLAMAQKTRSLSLRHRFGRSQIQLFRQNVSDGLETASRNDEDYDDKDDDDDNNFGASSTPRRRKQKQGQQHQHQHQQEALLPAPQVIAGSIVRIAVHEAGLLDTIVVCTDKFEILRYVGHRSTPV